MMIIIRSTCKSRDKVNNKVNSIYDYFPSFCCLLTKLCPTLYNLMNCRMPGSSVLHYLPEFAQIHSVMLTLLYFPLLILYCPVLLLPSIFSSIRVFSSESALHIRWSKYWSFSFTNRSSNKYSGLISFKTDWSPCSPRDSQESSPASEFENISSLALSLLYGPTVTSIHD